MTRRLSLSYRYRRLFGVAIGMFVVAGCAASTGAKVRWDLWNAASENVAKIQLLVTSEHDNSAASVGPGGLIVFESNRNGNTDIWLYDPTRGQAVQQLTTDPGPDRFPSFLGDGKRFTFLSNRLGEGNASYFVGTVGSPAAVSVVPVTKPAIGTFTSGQVSPDGKTFAYSSSSHIWTYDLESNTRTQLIEGYDPAWTPDGKRLIFRRKARDFGRFVSTSLWSSKNDGTEVTEILPGSDAVSYSEARVSPDGGRICYTRTPIVNGPSGNFGNRDIWVSRTDGTQQTQLTTSPGNDSECSWYDLDRIVFSSDRPVTGKKGAEFLSLWLLSLPK